MALFGKLKAAVGKVFGSSVLPTLKVSGRRGEAEAATHAEGQSARRKKLLERRVESGESEKVYANKKPINLLSTGVSPQLSSVTIEAFLDGHNFSRFASSNVWSIQYDRTTNKLFVQYMGGRGKNRNGAGRWVEYSNVDIGEAKTMFNAASKGVWSWDHLRIRKTARGTRKPFRRDVPPPAYLPLGRKKSNILQSP